MEKWNNMFGKLKDKLKSALSIFSKKAEEEADVEEIEVEKEVPIVEEKVTVAKKVDVKKVEPLKEKKVIERKEEKKVVEKKVTLQKVQQNVEMAEKKSVLIFHGWEDNSESGFIPALREDLHRIGYEALSFNQPDTEKPKFEKWFSFAEDKIEKVDKKHLCVVGHSMGGLLALKLAEKHKFKKLILVAPVGVKPSIDYFKLVGKRLNPQELDVFKKYQARDLDIKKIKHNVQEIAFVFGLQDPWITQEIRDFYIKSFKDVAEIHVFEEYAHMSESEGVKEVPLLKDLFSKKLSVGVIEHRGEKKLARPLAVETKPTSAVSAAPVKKNLLAQQMEHFAKLKEAEKQKEELKKEEVVEQKKFVEEKVVISDVEVDEAEEVDEEIEEVVSVKQDIEKEKIILSKEKDFIEESDENEEKEEKKEESTGFFGKLKKTFSFKKEESTVEDDFAGVEDDVAAKKVELKKVEVKQSVIKTKVQEVSEDDEVKSEKKGLFVKIKETITSRTISEEKFEELFWDLELALLENNVSVEVIEKIKVDLKRELVNKPLPWDVSEKIHKTLTKTLHDILAFESQDIFSRISAKKKGPYVVAFFGINGAGETTSIAKLTYHLQQQGLSVVLAACDTFRAAAIQQLGEHAQRLGVKMIQHNYGSDAAAVAFDAVQYAEKNKVNVVLIDTAGRLHSKTKLMAGMQKIIRVVKPDLKIFVGESITGNDCIEQARQFNALVEMDGAILTKADVDEKGGAPLSIAYTIKKPILFLGVGQRYKDFEQFDKEKMLERLGI